LIDGLVEFFPTKGRDDLNGRKFDDLCPKVYEARCKYSGLITGSGDQNLSSRERFFVPLTLPLSPTGRGRE
jgi:hypothetical protein